MARATPFDDAPVGLALVGPDLRYLAVNDTLAAINGAPTSEHLGRLPSELLGELGEQIEAYHREVLRSRRTLEFEFSGATPADPASERHWLVSYYPVENGEGRLRGVGAVVVDVTDRHEAEERGERLRRRAEFLAHAAALLASSLDVDATIRSVVDAAVPELGDWCAFALVEEGELRLWHLAGGPGTDPAHAAVLRDCWPLAIEGPGALATVLRSGEAALLSLGDELLRAAARSDEHHERLCAVGITTAILAPLVTPTGVPGLLALVRTGDSPPHGEDDLVTAQALADRAAVAIGHARAHGEAQQRLALLDTLLESAPVGIAFLDAELRYVRVNGQLASMNGALAEEHIGRTPADILGPPAERAMQVLRGVLEDGRTVVGDVEVDVPTRSGARHFLTSCAPVDVDGERIGVTAIVIDVTERRAVARRERLLSRAAAVLEAELDPAAAARRLCELVVAEVADACEVQLTGDDHEPRVLACAPDDDAAAGAQVALPLVARGRELGMLRARRHPGPFTAADRRLLEELAPRAALVLDNLRLYAAQKHIASSLQARLLPRRLPRIDGLELATSYRAAGRHNDVGGDFFDVFATAEGGWTALVGDVAGKGAEAAALTASIRQIVRTASRWTEDPGEMLALVNDELLREESGLTCTIAHTSLHDGPDGFRVAVTLAGHPHPLVLRADGTVEAVGRPGTLLGGLEALELETDVVALGPGDLLLLYTDGALETGRGQPGFPLLDLERVLAGCAGADAQEVVRRVEAAAVDAAGGTAPDDIALVCLRRRP